jgi:hypothetical protein
MALTHTPSRPFPLVSRSRLSVGYTVMPKLTEYEPHPVTGLVLAGNAFLLLPSTILSSLGGIASCHDDWTRRPIVPALLDPDSAAFVTELSTHRPPTVVICQGKQSGVRDCRMTASRTTSSQLSPSLWHLYQMPCSYSPRGGTSGAQPRNTNRSDTDQTSMNSIIQGDSKSLVSYRDL